MRITGPQDGSASRGTKALALLPRRCEKASSSSPLNGYRQSGNFAGESSTAPVKIELVSQEETHGFDPFWDGPRLLPTFVAQVMGQAMEMPERRDTSIGLETAYGSVSRKALVLDRKS